MPRIQEYYSLQYSEKRYRISVFNKFTDLRPTYKGQVEDPLHELGIWHDGNHFHGLRTVSSLFDKNYYCV